MPETRPGKPTIVEEPVRADFRVAKQGGSAAASRPSSSTRPCAGSTSRPRTTSRRRRCSSGYTRHGVGDAGHPRPAVPARVGALQGEGLVHAIRSGSRSRVYPDRKHKSVPAAVFDLTLKPFANGRRAPLARRLVGAGRLHGHPERHPRQRPRPLVASNVEYKSGLSRGVAARSDRAASSRARPAARASASAAGGAATGRSSTTGRTRSDRRMKGILSSYRWRRRLAWIGGIVALVVGFVVAAFAAAEGQREAATASSRRAPKPAQTVANVVEAGAPHRGRPAGRQPNARRVRPDGRDAQGSGGRVGPRDAGDAERRHAASSGTAASCRCCRIPATISDHPTWNVLTAYPGDVTIDLLLQPRRGAKRGPIAFAVELKKAKQRRWLVDSMIPEQGFAPRRRSRTRARRRRPGAERSARAEGEAGPLWFIVPGALLALIALVPVLFLLNTWRTQPRDRTALPRRARPVAQ